MDLAALLAIVHDLNTNTDIHLAAVTLLYEKRYTP